MTRQPFDEFSKQLFEALLTPYGRVTVDRTVPGEARRIDIYFEPNESVQPNPDELGLLATFSTKKNLFEPFRSPPMGRNVRDCALKLYALHAELHRVADRTLPNEELPSLWILASSVSDPLLDDFGAELQATDIEGIYICDRGWFVGIINIDELPVTEDTLWMRLLGKGTTQENAIEELLLLPETTPKRATALNLLRLWQINIEMTGTVDQEEERFLMALSQAYLEWERQTLQRGREQGIKQGARSGKADLILLQLRSRLPLSPELETQIVGLSTLDELAIALLNFNTIEALAQWLRSQR
jgi:hypothetical protein